MADLRVDAVVTVFDADADLQVHVDAVLPQVRRVVVVDDGSRRPPSLRPDDRVEVLTLEHNSGIAQALNVGIRACLDAGADAVLTLDQDTAVPDGAVSRLVRVIEQHADRVAFAAPEKFAEVSQVWRRESPDVLLTRHTIQSAMLVPRATFDRVGLLRDDLFIDLVDTEFELRCHAAGLDGLAAPGLAVGHRLGRRYERGPLGRLGLPGFPPQVTLSTPFRYYYRVRNRIVLNRSVSWRGRAGWLLRDTVIEVLHFVNVLVVARPRRAMWRIMRAAVSDARSGRLGRAPDDVMLDAAQVSWSVPEMVES